MRLSQAIETLVIATRADGRTEATVSSYRRKLKPLLIYLGDRDVSSISADDLRRYVAHLMDRTTIYANHPKHQEREGGLSPHTIASYVRSLKRLWSFLQAEGVIDVSPAQRIRVPRPAQRELKAADLQDFLALLATSSGASAADRRDRCIIILLADTGIRVGGLTGLRVQDVDLGTGLGLVTEKGGKTRFVPFSRPTHEALVSWLETRPQDQGSWLFVSLGNKATGRLTPSGVTQMLKRRARAVGISGRCNPHSFRHMYAREFLLSGGDLASLADLLGHSSVEVTQQSYARFTTRELQEKARRHSPVSRLFGGNGDGDS